MKNKGLLNINNQTISELSPEIVVFFKERISAHQNEKLSKKDLILRCACLELIIMQGKLRECENEIDFLISEKKRNSLIETLPKQLDLIANRIVKERIKRVSSGGGAARARNAKARNDAFCAEFKKQTEQSNIERKAFAYDNYMKFKYKNCRTANNALNKCKQNA
jgi:hypothetical protein